MKQLELVVTEADARERLDRFVARAGGVPRGQARRAIESGAVYIDGKRTKVASRGLHPGQKVRVVFEEAGRADPDPDPISLRVLYEDEALLAVDKPSGTPAQPTLAGDRGALTSQVARHLKLRSDRDVGLVHRLDRETSGITIFGKTSAATRALALAFREGSVRKTYFAIACGPIVSPHEVTAWLAKDPSKPGLFKPSPNGTGVPAETRVEPLSPSGAATAVACFPRTGRTHQIRVHLLSLGAPILGDRRYGAPMKLEVNGATLAADRVLLHARALELAHPLTGATLHLESPLPEDLAAAMKLLGAR